MASLSSINRCGNSIGCTRQLEYTFGCDLQAILFGQQR